MSEKTYLIEFYSGKRQKITIPESWKITFGPAVVGKPTRSTLGGRPDFQIPMALRIYETDTKQRAIFLDVKNFRDMSIKIEEEESKTQEKDGYMECDGVRKRTTFQATVKEWINPDEPRDLPALPHDEDVFGVDY